MLTLSPDALAAIVATLRSAGCVYAEDEAALLIEAAGDERELAALVSRRVGGLPLEQVVGWAEFCGLRLVVAPGVFVPRRRTEFLVSLAIAGTEPGSVVLDICCGVGGIGAAIAAKIPTISLYGVDVDPTAVDCARRNAPDGEFFAGDLFAGVPPDLRGRVDVLVANAPYVPSGEIAFLHAEARDHERRAALDGGADGLDVQRAVIDGAPAWLRPGGRLFIETSELQSAATLAAFQLPGFDARIESSEDLDATVVVGALLSGGATGS